MRQEQAMELILAAMLIIRLAVPLSIFKYQFWGGLASVIADTVDYGLFDLTVGVPSNYQEIDKALDMYFLSIALVASMKWASLARTTSLLLFIYRAIGVVLFEATNLHALLFMFPNVFEYFFMVEAGRKRFFPKFELTPKRLLAVLLLLSIPKLILEYALHVMGLDPWQWIKANLLFMNA